MLAVMYASPILFLGKLKYLNSSDIMPGALVVSIIVSCLFNSSLFRLSSLLYTCMFVGTFLLFKKSIMTTNIRIEQMMHFLKFIIILYSIVLIIQQLSFLLNLPIINEAYGGENERSLKMNSLTIEPSNTGPIVTILLYVYIKLREYRTGCRLSLKQLFICERKLVMAYIYICIGSFSVSCVFSLFVFLIYFVNFRHFFQKNFSIICLSAIIVGIVIYALPELYERMSNLITAIITLDPQTIYEIDSSSSARLTPPIIYINEFSLLNSHVWLGYGMGYGGAHTFSVLSAQNVDEFTGMGGIIQTFFDNGLITGMLLLYFMFKLCKGFTYALALFFLIIFLQFSLNSYVLWLFAFCMIIIDHYSMKYSNVKIS